MKRAFLLFITYIVLSIPAYAQEYRVSTPRRDSVVVEDGEGHRNVSFISRPYRPAAGDAGAEVSIKRDPFRSIEERVKSLEGRASAVLQHVRSVPSRDLSSYYPGSIPINESVSPTGGRIYSIPITPAAGWDLTPAISLSYNSQSGNDVGGFGWGLSGLSEIRVRSGNPYYDSESSCGIYDAADVKYSLDGVPLVTSSMGMSDYTLSMCRGNIQVRKHADASGRALYFSVLYPDGTSAVFGFPSSTYPKSSYPITQLSDLAGNTISFSYFSIDNCYYISSISYGDDATISFTYAARSDGPSYKYARNGQYYGFPKRLLKTITSKDGNVTIVQYSLTHEVEDGVSLLKELHCTSGQSELPPLAFDYGVDTDGENAGTPSFILTDQSVFPKYFRQSADTTVIYKRGRLIPGSENDAVISLPSFSTYAYKGHVWNLWEFGFCEEYGSDYSADQEILCSFTGFMYSAQRSILAEGGFQLIEAVDVDGDGVDELVKINNWSSSDNVTTYKISIYSFGTDFNYTNTSFTVTVNAGLSNAVYNNPAKSYYRFGDFRGDGRMLLLIMTQEYSKFALIDLNAQQKLSEDTLFTTGDAEDNLVLAADFENDGKTDLCHITTSGMDVYSVPTSTGTALSLRTTYTGVSRTLLYTDPFHTLNGSHEIPARLYALDINGDGYLDIASAPALNVYTDNNAVINTDIWNIARFTGKQFSTETYSVYLRSQDDAVVFLDVDKDGLPDMLHLHGNSLLYSPNVNGLFVNSYTYTQLSLDAGSGLVPGDITLFGVQGDILVMSGAFANIYEFSIDHTKSRELRLLTDSFGNHHYSEYSRMGNRTSPYLIDTERSYSASEGFSRLRASLNVLENGYTISGSQIVSSSSYLYWDAVWHSRGLGFCGFGKISVGDNVNSVYTQTRFNPEKFGAAEEISTSKTISGTPYLTVVNTYDSNSTTYGKLNPRLTRSVSTDSLTGIETTTTITYGSYDFPTTILTSRRIGSGTAKTEKVQRTYTHSISPSKYVLGAVTEESVIKEGDGMSVQKWEDKSVLTYDGCYRPLTKKHYVGQNWLERRNPHLKPNAHEIDTNSFLLPTIIVHEADNLLSETRWQYDSNGKVLSEKSAPYGASEFIGTTYTYDNAGRYVVSKTDALGLSEVYRDYNKFGQPGEIEDAHGNVTYITYDAWGKGVIVSRPDGAMEQTTLAWGGQGLYMESKAAPGVPETVTHYDALGREIRMGEKRFDGQWQWVDREYDSRGRLYRVSLPYRGTSAGYWNTYSYDQYNRPISLTEASGKASTWSYDGPSVTTVKDGITSTGTTDANGAVVSVTDAGGTVTYTLRDDGRPSKVTAPGNVSTTSTYDEYGRRTMMVDPSAGTQTYAYEWNSDGSSKLTHTNSHGTVKTYQDKYGRTTLIERPGEYNTTFTYDSYGRLTAEQSTNGTKKEYTYDNYDRVVTAKETVPDGKWLQKAYSYSSGSVLAAIQYVNQSGPITTETYSYANGHNTGIFLPDSTAVWSLTSENDFGLPTAITTGTVSREYGYTAFGMPTCRRMNGGNLQNFTYNFDIATGNLLSRSDVINGQTENFGYDSLNRLVSMGSRQITYADNGNILSVGGVGTMAYSDTQHPYRLSTLTPENLTVPVVQPPQTITYNGAEHPVSISQDGITASLTYNGSDDRVKMTVTDSADTLLTRYYIGDRYEYELSGTATKERLYLGGDAYSAPMVYQREGNGSWAAYNIGRDYLGNITHIATVSGTLVAEYGYDPWGRLRDPETLTIYSAGNVPDLFLGRGFTGHEHLPWFGLVNMNARLYDPLVGRFLSYDPYVQAPDFTQNFNRYSYCVNNPLKYTDESGKFVFSLFLGPLGAVLDAACWGAVIGGATYTAGIALSDSGFDNWSWSDFGRSVGFGALSGAVTFGIGEAFSAIGNFAGTYGTELIRGVAHGLTQGGMSSLQGGNFWSGFASGALGSWAASGYSILGIEQALGETGMLVFSSIVGGISSVINGGDFWKGAYIGLITAGFNHLQHKTEEYKFFDRLRRHYSKGNGEDFVLTGKEFNYLASKGKIDYANAKIGEDGYYTASIDFYDAGSDLKYSFGKASVKFYSKGLYTRLLGFYDRYDFDAKSWGTRSISAELITRGYGSIVSGTSFDIYYNKSLFVK